MAFGVRSMHIRVRSRYIPRVLLSMRCFGDATNDACGTCMDMYILRTSYVSHDLTRVGIERGQLEHRIITLRTEYWPDFLHPETRIWVVKAASVSKSWDLRLIGSSTGITSNSGASNVRRHDLLVSKGA